MIVPGHGLVSEGWAHDKDGRKRDSRNEPGYALCSCGVLEGPFLNTAQRKRWHKNVHKEQVKKQKLGGGARRGASNRNSRGSAAARRARKLYLMDVWRADVDAVTVDGEVRAAVPSLPSSFLAKAEPAVRCWRCGILLTFETMTVDRIKPGCKGGTYRRENLRPACPRCNSETGGKLGAEQRAKKTR